MNNENRLMKLRDLHYLHQINLILKILVKIWHWLI